MRILIATTNQGKAREMTEAMGDRFEVVNLRDLAHAPDLEETGNTFRENAIAKAVFYHRWSGLPTIAGDGGLEIDALGGEPGVFSRRWPTDGERPGMPGREKNDREMIDIALTKLAGIPTGRRTARLRDVEAYHDGLNTFTEEGAIEGRMVTELQGGFEPGYPFRAIFLVSAYDKLFRDLTEEEHARVNHRKRSLTKLRERILREGIS